MQPTAQSSDRPNENEPFSKERNQKQEETRSKKTDNKQASKQENKPVLAASLS